MPRGTEPSGPIVPGGRQLSGLTEQSRRAVLGRRTGGIIVLVALFSGHCWWPGSAGPGWPGPRSRNRGLGAPTVGECVMSIVGPAAGPLAIAVPPSPVSVATVGESAATFAPCTEPHVGEVVAYLSLASTSVTTAHSPPPTSDGTPAGSAAEPIRGRGRRGQCGLGRPMVPGGGCRLSGPLRREIRQRRRCDVGAGHGSAIRGDPERADAGSGGPAMGGVRLPVAGARTVLGLLRAVAGELAGTGPLRSVPIRRCRGLLGVVRRAAPCSGVRHRCTAGSVVTGGAGRLPFTDRADDANEGRHRWRDAAHRDRR